MLGSSMNKPSGWSGKYAWRKGRTSHVGRGDGGTGLLRGARGVPGVEEVKLFCRRNVGRAKK